MATDQHRDILSEETPLIERRPANQDETECSISFARGTAITVVMGLLLFTQATNMSMMTTAQSDIAADFDAFAQATWFTSAYMIAMSSMTPLAGRLSQIFTARIYIVFSSTLLSLGLFITAIAQNLTVFLLGRTISGCGSGGLMSTSIILALDLTSRKRRGLFVGMINAGFTTGVSSGAILAGLLTPTLGWRFIFWVQAPLTLILGPMLFFAIPSLPDHRSDQLGSRSILWKLARVDYAGALTLALSVFLFLYSLAAPEISVIPILLSLISFAMFLVIESKFTTEPIIPTPVLKLRGVLFTCLAGLGLMMGRWAVLFFTPVYAMAVRGWGAASAGLILVPTNAGFGLGGLLVGWIHIRQTGSYYSSCLVAFILFALSSMALSYFSTPFSPAAVYVCTTFLNGFFAGALMNYTLAHLLHLTSPKVHYIVTSLVAMSRGFAGSFGSAVGGGLFSRELKRALETGFSRRGLIDKDELIRKLLGSPALVMDLTGADKEVAINSYQKAVQRLFLAAGALALATTIVQAGTGRNPPKGKGRQEYSSDSEDN